MADARNPEPWGTLIIADGFCGDIFATQRRLRGQLLDGSFIRYAPARDLAAHMLLRLDDLAACWSLATHWLRKELECHRVDAGFGAPHATTYLPSLAEAKDANYDVPTLGGSVVDNHDPIMQAMWLAPRPVVFADIKQDRRLQMRLRQRLSKARTKTKFGGALRAGNGSYGLICADWTEHFAPNDSNIYDRFEQTVVDVLGPIIAVAKAIDDREHPDRGGRAQGVPAGIADGSRNVSAVTLTVSETEVARLVAKGMSYKEIALIRGRSFSTIDHQLRSIRQKTGVSSTSALISLLARMDLPQREVAANRDADRDAHSRSEV
ncbi:MULTISPECIES: helix-turn-helix transcriptional regulator [unclassified Ensifer]|uniref:helix-turn-helix transcriptional regulator n=1 Tax=unclassified Ensifer TaxID=2633371 RepID=UPI00300FED27